MNLENHIITENVSENQDNVADITKVISETEPSTVIRTIDKTTYVVGLHFKEQGLTFTEVLKRVLKGAGTEKIL